MKSNTYLKSSPKLGEVAAKLTEESVNTQRSQQTPSPLRGTPPNLGGEFKLLILLLSSLFAPLISVAVIFQLSSCTSESDPVAPSFANTRTVTVQLNAEAKPAFGQVESGKMTATLMSGANKDESAATRAAAIGLHEEQLSSFNSQLSTRSAASGTWVEGDEVIAQVMLTTGNGMLISYTTLKRTAEGNWQVVEDKSVTFDGNTSVVYDYHLLAEETLTSLNALTVKVPEDETVQSVIVVLTYAPEMELVIDTDTGGTITRAEISTRATALTSYPEEWLFRSTDTNGWYTPQARIRIRTGKEGDVVKYGNSNTATTNSAGDAYFYLTEINSNITITRNDVTVTLVPTGTTITAGQAYWHDASWSAEEGLVVVDGSDIDASYTIPTEAKTLYIQGITLTSNGATSGVSTYLGAALQNNTTVKAVILPEVTEIPSNAFNSCSALTTVSAPKATTIGNDAFYYCTSLTTVTLPEATTIGEYAFSDCYALKEVSLPKATTIGDKAFHTCSGLTTVDLPLVATIEVNTFYECTALTTVNLPKATTIGTSAFQRCSSLTVVTFGSVITSVGSDAFKEFTTENCTLTLASGQQSATLAPSGNTWAGYTWKEIIIAE